MGVVNMACFGRPRPVHFEGIVELEKRSDGRFYLGGAPLRVRLVGEQSGQKTSLLENMASKESTPLGYTIDVETGAILVPIVEGETNHTIRLYEILGEDFI